MFLYRCKVKHFLANGQIVFSGLMTLRKLLTAGASAAKEGAKPSVTMLRPSHVDCLTMIYVFTRRHADHYAGRPDGPSCSAFATDSSDIVYR